MLFEGNRIYIASKVGRMEERVNALTERLEKVGYVIPYDWTKNPVQKPFVEHIEQATKAAEAMARAVMECDILIVLCAEGGLGYHIETGGALVASIIMTFIAGLRRKHIFVIGEGNDRSVFYFHESVVRLPDEDALFEILPINSAGIRRWK